MSNLTNKEIESLKEQLKQKTEEIRVIYDKLIEAGVVELPDDFLDLVSGGSLGPTLTEKMDLDSTVEGGVFSYDARQ